MTATNDLPALTVRSLSFSAAGYIINGSAMTLVSGAEVLDSRGRADEHRLQPPARGRGDVSQ